MADKSAPKLPCRSEPCKYHGHWRLQEWCRHPDHLEPLAQRLELPEVACGKCASFVDWEVKVMPGSEPKWPMPVDIAELFRETVSK